MVDVSPSHFKMSPSQRGFQWITKGSFYSLLREVEILNGTLLNHLRTSLRLQETCTKEVTRMDAHLELLAQNLDILQIKMETHLAEGFAEKQVLMDFKKILNGDEDRIARPVGLFQEAGLEVPEPKLTMRTLLTFTRGIEQLNRTIQVQNRTYQTWRRQAAKNFTALHKKHEAILEHLKQFPVYRPPVIHENISNIVTELGWRFNHFEQVSRSNVTDLQAQIKTLSNDSIHNMMEENERCSARMHNFSIHQKHLIQNLQAYVGDLKQELHTRLPLSQRFTSTMLQGRNVSCALAEVTPGASPGVVNITCIDLRIDRTLRLAHQSLCSSNEWFQVPSAYLMDKKKRVAKMDAETKSPKREKEATSSESVHTRRQISTPTSVIEMAEFCQALIDAQRFKGYVDLSQVRYVCDSSSEVRLGWRDGVWTEVVDKGFTQDLRCVVDLSSDVRKRSSKTPQQQRHSRQQQQLQQQYRGKSLGMRVFG